MHNPPQHREPIDDLCPQGFRKLPNSVATELESRLLGGEQIVWQGRPSRANREDLIFALVGWPVVALGAACTIASFVSATWVTHVLGSFGYVFIAFGALLLLPWATSYRACYVLTNRRVFIWMTGYWGIARPGILYPEEFTTLEVVRESNGCGDLVVAREMVQTSEGPEEREHGFFGVKSPRAVEQLVRDTLFRK